MPLGAADVAWIDVLPSMRDFLPTLRGATAAASATVGAESGRIFSNSFADAVATATGKLQAAQKRAADAAGSLSVAQARLNDLQETGVVSAGRMAAAEEAVAKAQRNLQLQTDGVARAQGALTRTQAEQAVAGELAASKHTALSGAMGGVVKTSGILAGALTAVNKAYSLMFAGFTLALPILPLVAAAHEAGNFQAALVRLVTTAGETNEGLKIVGPGILKMAGQVGIGANELAAGMYIVESAGFHGAGALDVLKASAQGARQEQAQLGDVANAVSTILHDYGKPASEAALVTSQLIQAVSRGKTTFGELTASLHSVTPVASKVGISLADVAATLSAMTQSGETADQATENMRNAILTLQKPSQGMISELAQIGIQASDLQTMLADPKVGLSGSLENISRAIINHMGPAGTVLLDALNKSTLGAQGLQSMLGSMSGHLKDLSLGLIKGTTGISDYRKEVRSMGGQAGATGLQFLSLYQQSDGFNKIISAGGPAVQTYQQALQRATGTQATYTVALQTTRENAAQTAQSIELINGALAQGDGNIKGWSEVQGTFNQKLAEAKASLQTMAIELGTHMLPALSTFLVWVADRAVPGLEHFGAAISAIVHSTGFQQFLSTIGGLIHSVVGSVGQLITSFSKSGGLHDLLTVIGFAGGVVVKVFTTLGSIAASTLGTLVDLFGKLPGPLQAVVVGFVALRAAAAAGLFDGLAIRTLYFIDTIKRMGTVAVATAGQMTAAYREAAATSGIMTEIQTASGGASRAAAGAMASIQGLGAAAGAAGKGGLAVLKTGMSGLLSVLGGGVGAGLLAVASAVAILTKAVNDNQAKIDGWAQALAKGGKAAAQAQQDMNSAPGFWDRLGFSMTHAGSSIGIVGQRAKEAEQKYQEWYRSLTPVERKTQDVTKAQNDLSYALDKFGPSSREAASAAELFRSALEQQKRFQDLVNDSEKTHLQRLEEIANKELATINSSLASKQANLELASSIDQYKKDLKDANISQNELDHSSNALAQQAYRTAEASATAAVDQAKANGETDLGQVSNRALLKSLQDAAKEITGPGHEALMGMIATLQKATTTNNDLANTVDQMGIQTVRTWDNNTRVLQGATAEQIKSLQGLGYEVINLPGMPGHPAQVVVTSDTGPARDQLESLIREYQSRQISINAAPAVHGPTQSSGGLAGGGPVIGPGSGTSDTAGLFALSNGEHVWTARETQAAGGHSGVEAIRSAVLAGGGGMADGGAVGGRPIFATYPYSISSAVMDAIRGQIAALFPTPPPFSGGGGGGGSAEIRALGQQIANSMGYGGQFAAIDFIFTHESGWNPTAQNPTSTAYGIPQFLDSTWGPYGGKTSDPATQIRDGIQYMVDRYGSPNAAAAFWQSHNWYDQGGLWPSGSIGHNDSGGTERVLTPAQDSYFKRFVDTTAAQSHGGVPVWHFYLGDREITDLVDSRLEWRDDAMARGIRSSR